MSLWNFRKGLTFYKSSLSSIYKLRSWGGVSFMDASLKLDAHFLIHHYSSLLNCVYLTIFFRIYLSSGHFFLTYFQKTTSLAVNCEQILFIRMRDLKQLGFFEWRTTTGSGLFAFLRGVFWPNCLYKSEDTRQYKLGNIEAYLKGKVLTSGWRASLKNVSLKFAPEINTSFADHNKCSRKTLEWYLISEEKLQHDKKRNHISKGYVHPNLSDI